MTYTYDALDNRIGMDENGTQTWTLFDGSDPIMDFSSSGSLEMRYLNGPAGDLVDTVLARQTSGGTVSWYLPDRLGTIRDLISSSGSIIDHVDYSAFGTVLDESSPSSGDRMMGFAGLERDTITGLNLAVFRVENPATGKWDSQDPLGFAGGDTNLNRYGGDDPVNEVDPSGCSDKPDNPVPTDLTIGNPGNTIVLIGPDGPGPKGPHELNYPNTFTGTYRVPPANIFYFNDPASFQKAINQASALGLNGPQVVLIAHGKYGTIYFDNTTGNSDAPPARMGVAYDSDLKLWLGNDNLNLFVKGMRTLKPKKINLMACTLFNYNEGKKMRQLVQRFTGAITEMSSGTTHYFSSNTDTGHFSHGDGSDLEPSPGGSIPTVMPGKATHQ